MFTLLMTCVGGGMSAQAIHFAKNSVRHDVRVIGVDADENAQGRHFADVFYATPFTESADYIPFLVDVVKSQKVDLILPGSDEEALVLAKHRRQFEECSCQIACPDYKTLEVLANKAETYRRLTSIDGVAVPVLSLIHI